MLRLTILFLFLFLWPDILVCQDHEIGAPFIQNYSPKAMQGSAQNWSAIQDERQIMYFANGDQGVIVYDGSEWRQIPVTNLSTVRTLSFHNGIVYAGAIGDFGRLLPDNKGKLYFQSLLDKLNPKDRNFADVWTSHSTSKGMVFYTDSIIFRINNDTVDTWYPKTGGFFLSYKVNDEIYIQEFGVGLQRIDENNKLVLLNNGDKLKNDRIYFILPYKNDTYLIGSRTSGLLIYDPEAARQHCLKNLNPETSRFFRENYLYNGIELPNRLFAFGTILTGFVVCDYEGNIMHKIDVNSGLNDEVVYSMFIDHQQSLWLTLSNGVAKVELFNPITIYPETMGLKGSVLATIRFDDAIYAGTFVGIYKLENNRFVKIDGIQQQSWDLNAFVNPEGENILLGGVNSGLYQIKDNKGTLIDKMPVCFVIEQSKKHKNRLYVGFQNGLRILEFENNEFKTTGDIENLNTAIRSIFEMPDGNLWLGTNIDGVYYVDFKAGQDPLKAKVTNYNDKHGFKTLNDIRIYKYNQQLFFATSSGNYIFNKPQQRFVKSEIFNRKEVDVLERIFMFSQDEQHNYWFSTGSHKPDPMGYLTSNANNTLQVVTKPFKRIPSMGVYSLYNDKNLTWIGGTEGLYRYDMNKPAPINLNYKAHIRKVLLQQDSVIFYGTFYDSLDNQLVIKSKQPDNFVPEIKYHENDITFFFSSSNYIAETETQYKYQLDGYDKTWSEWALRRSKEYTNIPEGDYAFRVQAKNIYDEESTIAEYRFVVLPPWYRTLLAYFIYAVLVFSIIRIIVRFYTLRLKQANIHLEETVKKRTVEIEQQKEEIQAQAEQLAKTNKELEKLSIVASETNNGVMILDAEYNIEWVNEGFCRLFKYDLNELLKKRKINLLKISRDQSIKEKLASLLNEKKSIVYEAENKTFQKEKRWVQTSITPILDDQNNITKLIAIYSDINALKMAQKEITLQHDEIFRQKMEITDSIIYSRHIQQAILPSDESIKSLIPESFIFNQPKEIIGGDFYWTSRVGDLIIVSVADCTGHGVPGALMSMLGITYLNEIVNNKGITQPAEILNRLRNRIIKILHQEDKEESSQDGMDMTVCSVNKKKKQMYFAGANNPLIICRGGNLIEVSPDKMPIRQYIASDKSFTQHLIHYSSEDTFYLFSDGFADQFGGPEGKKYLYQHFKNLLAETARLPMNDQRRKIEQTFDAWKGDQEQVDDVLVMGFRLDD